ncbi:MAG TPA: MarR family winged helix-turn-helix transcriptional regulator [Bryobacteraceae bacterium]
MVTRSASSWPVPSLDPVLDFMRLLWGIEHGLQSTSKRMRASHGVTGPQRLVLLIASQSPGISAGEVAHVVRLHPSTLTGVIQRLVDKRLLIRDRDPRDTRRIRLRIAAAGQRVIRRSRGTVEAAVERALRRMSNIQVRHAREVLLTVANARDGAAKN